MRNLFFILFGLLCFALKAGAVDWMRAERFSADSLARHLKGKQLYPCWIKNSHHFYYSIKRADKICYYLVDARDGSKKEMIQDNEDFIRQYVRITGDSSLLGKEFQMHGYQFRNNDFSRFYLEKKGKTLLYDMKTGILSETAALPKEKSRKIRKEDQHSKDSLYTMMGCGYNLFVRCNKTGQVKQITFDGKKDASYTHRNIKDTLISNAKGFWLGQRYIHLMNDMSEVEEISLVRSLNKIRPTTHTFKMPMPGDAGVRRYRIFWYNAESGESKYLPIEKYPDQVVNMDYSRSEEALYITRRSRKGDKIDLCRINVKEGSVLELISETCEPHINLTLFNYRILESGKYFIWWSERTGRGNYYLYNKDGKLLNRITQGEHLVAGNILSIDSVKREIVFVAYGNEAGIDPYYSFFYKAGLDGKRQVLLTPGNANHELSFSEDRKYAIDRYSRMDQLPAIRVISIDNPKKTFEIEKTEANELRAAGWQAPVLLKVKAADKTTDLYGLMYLPSNLDKTKKYPVICNVYPGPQDDQIPRSFMLDDNGNQSLAELGFIVVNVASRGSSPLRGRDFYCFGYGNLRDYPLADNKYVIEKLAEAHPYMDLNRVGIYGHSGGAFQTVAAMLTYPDFYRVGIAASGNHDNNMYIQWWGESFHGLSEQFDKETGKTSFSVQIPTNMELAGRLKGKLLLITGDEDKNVPPSSTYRLADALIHSGKRFDMFVFPGRGHDLVCPYYQNLIRYYFVENLIRPSEQHIDIINHR